MSADVLPMFPLGTALVPGQVLPLHVFEPRYRRLTEDVLTGDGRLGVVLIERGHEVGGDDHRTDLGTMAEVVRSQVLDDGRWLLITVGMSRIRVEAWLDDDPYPRARVASWPEDPTPVPSDLLHLVHDRLARVLELAARLGADVEEVQLLDDPVAASYQPAALGLAGPLDAHRLLQDPGPAARLPRVAQLLEHQEELLRFRLGGGTA